jgi:hypothetical protein
MAYICQQLDRAASLADRAVILNPNLSAACISRGWISLMLAKPERAIESFENLLRLSQGQKSSLPQAASSVSQVLKRDT